MNPHSISHVYLYAGKGAFGTSVKTMESFLGRFYPWTVTQVTEDEFTPSEWNPENSLCLFVGGHASELESALQDRFGPFKAFINEGGRALFTCGSSYAVAKERIFSGVKKQSSIPLFSGTAVGPLYPEKKATWINRAIPIIWKKTASCGHAALLGGGHYEIEESESVTVLACYQKCGRVAAFTHSIGKGVVGQTMVHFEEDVQIDKEFIETIDDTSKEKFLIRNARLLQEQDQLSPSFSVHCFDSLIEALDNRNEKVT